MAKEKRVIVRYGLEIPEQRRTPRALKYIVILILLGCVVTGLVLFARWISDDSLEYYEEPSLIGSPTATNTPRPTSSPSPTPVPTPRALMSQVLSDEYHRNANVAGLLYIKDASMSVMVYKGSDNEYYLTHSGSGQQAFAGEVFFDCNYPVNELKEGANIVLYGTIDNMRLGSLENYSSGSYFDRYKTIVLETLYAAYEFEIFAYYEPGAAQDNQGGQQTPDPEQDQETSEPAAEGFRYDSTEFEGDSDFVDFVTACKENSLHESDYVPYDTDTILTLAALPADGGDAVYVVQAYFKNKIVD